MTETKLIQDTVVDVLNHTMFYPPSDVSTVADSVIRALATLVADHQCEHQYLFESTFLETAQAASLVIPRDRRIAEVRQAVRQSLSDISSGRVDVAPDPYGLLEKALGTIHLPEADKAPLLGHVFHEAVYGVVWERYHFPPDPYPLAA